MILCGNAVLLLSLILMQCSDESCRDLFRGLVAGVLLGERKFFLKVDLVKFVTVACTVESTIQSERQDMKYVN